MNVHHLEWPLQGVTRAHGRFGKFDYDVEEELDRHKMYAEVCDDMIIDSVAYVNDAYKEGKKIITEVAPFTPLRTTTD